MLILEAVMQRRRFDNKLQRTDTIERILEDLAHLGDVEHLARVIQAQADMPLSHTTARLIARRMVELATGAAQP